MYLINYKETLVELKQKTTKEQPNQIIQQEKYGGKKHATKIKLKSHLNPKSCK
jgi:hypothetical protein